MLPPFTEWSKKCSLCGRNGYIEKGQSLLHDWHGELIGEADWAELSEEYAKKKEELNLKNGRYGGKERNKQQESKLRN